MIAPVSLDGNSILFVNNFAHDYLGGGEVHLLHVAQAAADARMRVTILAPPGSALASRAGDAGMEFIEQRLPGGNPLVARNALSAAIRRTDARLVQGNGYYTNLLVRMAVGAGGPITINTLHTMPLSVEKRSRAGRMRNTVDRLTATRAVAYVADAQAVADAYVALGVPAGRVSVIHNAVDPVQVRASAAAGPIPLEIEQARSRGEKVLVVVGRLESVKGIHEMLSAMRIISVECPQAILVWAGTGSLAGQIQQQVAADSVLSRCVRLLGYVENAHAVMGAADVVVMPSRAEGFNTAVLEAMALGRPVVATAVGGTAEAVIDGVTGVLVPSGEPAELAPALASLLRDSDRGRALGLAGRLRVEERFTVMQMQEAYLKLYERLLAGRAG